MALGYDSAIIIILGWFVNKFYFELGYQDNTLEVLWTYWQAAPVFQSAYVVV